ncbi:MAG: adenosylcobinamide-GDP ribazoletransferase [Pseudonocardiaceae bacterium]|nr:adenosylcobinamide-GDP ribazoletransferase [Pseudonocardiaceae bacterium]
MPGSRPDGLRLALSWLTVAPVAVRGPVDRSTARRALGWAPLVGLALGVLAAGALAGLRLLDAPTPLAGLLVVAGLAAATRGMHLDGLADTADGLGCYDRRRALEAMRDGAAGPFAVITLVLVLGLQASALGALASDRLAAVLVAVAAGRVAFGWCCRRAVPAARPEGLGTLVAGTQPPAVAAAWTAALLAAGLALVPGRPWQGVTAVAIAAGAVVALSWHTTRRFGGVTGDVLGAASELATTVILVVCALG